MTRDTTQPEQQKATTQSSQCRCEGPIGWLPDDQLADPTDPDLILARAALRYPPLLRPAMTRLLQPVITRLSDDDESRLLGELLSRLVHEHELMAAAVAALQTARIHDGHTTCAATVSWTGHGSAMADAAYQLANLLSYTAPGAAEYARHSCERAL